MSDARDSNDEHFATGHLLGSLKRRTVSSGAVTALAQGIQFFLNLGSIMVLARLLAPQDFGLVAMVSTILGFLRIFNDAGLSTATVQRNEITHAQVSNLFWTNVALAATISFALAALAPVIAWFFQEPRLVAITLLLSLTFLPLGSTVQHLALLKRQMRFTSIAIIQVGASLTGVSIGIGMAWSGYGYWALVGMNLGTAIASFIFTWSISKWIPQWPARGTGTRPLLKFGADLTLSSFVWSLAKGSDAILIGRFCGTVPLGLYSRAQALLLRPVEQFLVPMEAVFIPTLSRLQNEPERYRRIVFQVFEVVVVAAFFFSSLLFTLAHPLTVVVLGEKWQAAAPVFAGFTLVALYAPVANVAGWLLTSQGRSRDFLTISVIASLGTVVAFAIGIPWGPTGVAVSYSVSCLIVQLPLAYHVAGKEGPVTTWDLWSRFFTHMPIWFVVAAATWLARSVMIDSRPWVQLATCAPVGLLAGMGYIAAVAPTRRAAINLFQVLTKAAEAKAASQG